MHARYYGDYHTRSCHRTRLTHTFTLLLLRCSLPLLPLFLPACTRDDLGDLPAISLPHADLPERTHRTYALRSTHHSLILLHAF